MFNGFLLVSFYALINVTIAKILAGHDLTDFTDGFLHSMQMALDNDARKQLTELLAECVNCDRMHDCANRFSAAKRLRAIFMTFDRLTPSLRAAVTGL